MSLAGSEDVDVGRDYACRMRVVYAAGDALYADTQNWYTTGRMGCSKLRFATRMLLAAVIRYEIMRLCGCYEWSDHDRGRDTARHDRVLLPSIPSDDAFTLDDAFPFADEMPFYDVEHWMEVESVYE